jgi:hypothetical protein
VYQKQYWGTMEALILKIPPIIFLWLSGCFFLIVAPIDPSDLKNIVAAFGSAITALMAVLRYLKDRRLEAANRKLAEELANSQARLQVFESEREKFREEIRDRVSTLESSQPRK